MAGLGDTVADLARYRRWAAGARRTDRRDAGSAASLTETDSFGPNPGDLRMLSYAPRDLAAGAPLIVVLHGCTQSAHAYAEGAGWIELADRHGMVLLCPEQAMTNNPNRCFNWFQPEDTRRGSGEAESIRQMIRQIVHEHAIDPARIFVTGLSAGGAMTMVMLAAYPEVFAGGAVIAGLPYGAASNVQEALSAMFQGRSRSPDAWGDLVREASHHDGPWPRLAIWHGDADTTVRPSTADEIAKQWADVCGLPVQPTFTNQYSGFKRSVWKTKGGASAVELNLIAGLGHGTPITTSGPDGCGRAGPYLLEAGVSSSVEALRFWGLQADLGLADQPQQAQQPRTAAARPDLRPRKPVDLPLSPEKFVTGVEQVITRALAAAGLMK